ncbi:YidH family protein [Brevundimonas lenta]|uniref:Uncharacterized membrane protein YidH (DUF202 family) n=1 Tax=Brevundimonas lenta TaxID=424796 RepID=A0A7W6NPZ0_9CAUL|nr:DUF202 domain-containing protein [Brevundimonas lenta]MBB4082685.1 uncharacterized membrane protein YidH (DUF202 family) [Brevundimonas lenta]
MAASKSSGAGAPNDPAFPSISTGKFDDLPEPPMPVVDPSNEAVASTQYSRYRTRLSTHRTGLSEHRTGLSEHRTDLSERRTNLSVNRTEMSMRRTGMSFQRTRMSADRTLMSVIRTSLSMIGFGFTIYSFFRGLASSGTVPAGDTAARFFGQALVVLGSGILALGIIYHLIFMTGLRNERGSMKSAELIHAESVFPVSVTLITAMLLFFLGIFAAIGMIFRIGPFG